MKIPKFKKDKRKKFAFKPIKICPNCQKETTEGHLFPACLREPSFWICGAEK